MARADFTLNDFLSNLEDGWDSVHMVVDSHDMKPVPVTLWGKEPFSSAQVVNLNYVIGRGYVLTITRDLD